MQAHKMKTRVTADHEIHLSVPDVPAGREVEVIVLAEASPTPAQITQPIEGDPREALRLRFPEIPALGPVVFHDDPCAPLPEGLSPQKVDETKVALRELGLKDSLDDG